MIALLWFVALFVLIVGGLVMAPVIEETMILRRHVICGRCGRRGKVVGSGDGYSFATMATFEDYLYRCECGHEWVLHVV